MARKGWNASTSRATQSPKKGEFFRSGYAYLTCSIGPTRFDDECAVYIDRLDGGKTVAIANPQEVRGVEPPLDQITQGEAVVRVVERIPGGFLIDPPGESLNSAGRVPVKENAIRFPR